MTGNDTPEFSTAMRGYDRLQVDEYVHRLREYAAEAEERARAAESELEVVRHTTVGPRVGEIFELAVTEAKEMQDRTKADADRVLAEARTQAEAIAERGRERERELKQRFEREREAAVADIEKSRRRAEAEVAGLKETKDVLIEDLRGMQQTLAALTGEDASGADGMPARTRKLRVARAPEDRQLAKAANG